MKARHWLYLGYNTRRITNFESLRKYYVGPCVGEENNKNFSVVSSLRVRTHTLSLSGPHYILISNWITKMFLVVVLISTSIGIVSLFFKSYETCGMS